MNQSDFMQLIEFMSVILTGGIAIGYFFGKNFSKK